MGKGTTSTSLALIRRRRRPPSPTIPVPSRIELRTEHDSYAVSEALRYLKAKSEGG